jgi:hypothetical protein
VVVAQTQEEVAADLLRLGEVRDITLAVFDHLVRRKAEPSSSGERSLSELPTAFRTSAPFS